jgi:hypothetical protein
MRLLMHCWQKMDPDRRGLTAAAVMYRLCKEPWSEPPNDRYYDEMRGAIETLVGKADSRLLGYYLRSYRRRIIDGNYFDHAGEEHKTIRWSVFPAEDFSSDGGRARQPDPSSPPTDEPAGGDGGDESPPPKTEPEPAGGDDGDVSPSPESGPDVSGGDDGFGGDISPGGKTDPRRPGGDGGDKPPRPAGQAKPSPLAANLQALFSAAGKTSPPSPPSPPRAGEPSKQL